MVFPENWLLFKGYQAFRQLLKIDFLQTPELQQVKLVLTVYYVKGGNDTSWGSKREHKNIYAHLYKAIYKNSYDSNRHNNQR